MTVNYKLLVSALIAICIASLTALISDVFRQFLIPSDSPFAIEHHLLRSPTLQKLGALVSNVICVVGFVGGGTGAAVGVATKSLSSGPKMGSF